MDLRTVWFIINIIIMAVMQDDSYDFFFFFMILILMQCHSYIADVHNKPTRLKNG